MPPIPHTAEPLDALRARYARALEHVYDQHQIEMHGAIRPGEVAANVFDCEDGLRLIVSREKDGDGRIWLHLSASFPRQSRMAEEFTRHAREGMRLKKLLRSWKGEVLRRFRAISGETREFTFLGWSGAKHIQHWVIEEKV